MVGVFLSDFTAEYRPIHVTKAINYLSGFLYQRPHGQLCAFLLLYREFKFKSTKSTKESFARYGDKNIRNLPPISSNFRVVQQNNDYFKQARKGHALRRVGVFES